ncbi:MAG: hypothetical protein ABSD74_08970 [Rhizomicrobium sp.]|jgi:hypothetical protein
MTLSPNRWLRLSPKPNAAGIFCDQEGLFVGGVPLVERICHAGGVDQWQSRLTSELDHDLSKLFGLPVDCRQKIAGIDAVARALNRGDVAMAQIAALNLQIPDPQSLVKMSRSPREIAQLASRLRASGMLKAEWDADEHPRWPAGSADSIGGQFAPAGSGTDSGVSGGSLIPVQLAPPIPVPPLEIPFPRFGPLPSEIFPPVPIPINPRELPRNPFPRNPKCAEEWAAAEAYCEKLRKEKKLTRGDDRRNRGFGEWMHQCLMGQVTEECGGNKIERFEGLVA